jgi:3-dehydroquinate synthase
VNIIQVKTTSGHYDVVCGRGALSRLSSAAESLRDSSGVFVLSSPRVWKFWGGEVARNLRGSRHEIILFDDREVAKRLATIETICRKLTRAGADRRALLIAVGGGVVGDVAGFAAASYLRGVRILHVPTTLVAQVDSAIGGKTGVDLPEGKNLVGAFYPPEMVIADPSTLRTLPPRQFRSGLYEVVKYAVIGDAELFDFLEREMDALLNLDMRVLEWVIACCARQKAHVVSKDERESGVRQILNFGHTIGHALETLTGYKRFLHGEAVGWGMLAATEIAVVTGQLPERDANRIASLVVSCGPLLALPCISSGALLKIISRDKKSRSGRIGWVLPRKIGAVEIGLPVTDKIIARVWRDLPGIYDQARKRN